MAHPTRSSLVAIINEDTEGTLKAPVAGSFIPLREGFSLSSELTTVSTDELKGGIGASPDIAVGEEPSASWSGYLRHSGTEGVAPEFGPILQSAMGAVEVVSTEYDTVAGSTTSVLNVDSGEGATFSIGEGLLVKDGTNGYSVRNIKSIATDALTLNFALDNAPASGVNLGKAIFYSPQSSGHTSYSIHHYQDASNSAFKQAISGGRTVNFTLDLPTRDLASISADIEGLNYFFNYITISASNNKIDITDDGGVIAVTLTNKTYQTPIDLADEIATKCTAASVGSGNDTFTCTYSSTTGKYTIASDGSTFSLLWNTGVNNANSVGTTIGFAVAADDTGALTYTSDSAITFNPPATATYDGEDVVVVKNAEILIGDATDNTCRKATNVSFTVATPKTQVLSACASNGVDSTFIGERTVTMSATLVLAQYEAELLNKALDNTTTSIMANIGPKDGSSNWQAGKVVNIYLKNAKIRTSVAENEGYYTLQIEASAFINSSTDKDVYINFL